MSSDGITAIHTVKQLFVTEINLDTQTVFGIVDGEEVVHVWISDTDLYVNSDENGNWFADFSGFDDNLLIPGACGSSEAWETGNNSTIIDWCVSSPPPEPWFTEFPPYAVEGWNWPTGATIHLTIDDPNTEVSPDFEQ